MDADTGKLITLQAFDVAGSSLTSHSISEADGATLTVSVPAIHSVKFIGPDIGLCGHGGAAIDDFTFNPITPIPEPSTLVLLCTGVVGLAAGGWRRKSKLQIGVTLLLMFALCTSAAYADTFGAGGNEFMIEFVTIGNPNNAADTWGPAGTVPYVYRMGKYEISRDMTTKANAEGSLEITLFDMTSYGGNGKNHPATGVSWNEAARFVNWLNTSEGFTPAYKFAAQPGEGGYDANANIQLWESGDAGYNSANPFRNDLAHYFLPSVDEWYKAAYYDPVGSSYFNFAAGSDTAPTAVASGTTAGTAVYDQSLGTGPADITLAGGLSPYGTMGQGGNVWEWEETEYDLANNSAGAPRGQRGGDWDSLSGYLFAPYRRNALPSHGRLSVGFRVASIPEPSTLVLLGMGVVGLLAWGWRRKR